MGRLGDPRSTEPLLNALADDHWQVRRAAAEALGRLGDARAVESLIQALADIHQGVRCAATEALGILAHVWQLPP
jgi:HEAT repeat protein